MSDIFFDVILPIISVALFIYIIGVCYSLLLFIKFKIRYPICSKTIPHYMLEINDVVTIECEYKLRYSGFDGFNGLYVFEGKPLLKHGHKTDWEELENRVTKVESEFGMKWYRYSFPKVDIIFNEDKKKSIHNQIILEKRKRRRKVIKAIFKL